MGAGLVIDSCKTQSCNIENGAKLTAFDIGTPVIASADVRVAGFGICSGKMHSCNIENCAKLIAFYIATRVRLQTSWVLDWLLTAIFRAATLKMGRS